MGQSSVYHPRTQNKEPTRTGLPEHKTHYCHLHQEAVLWRRTFPVTPLPQEELWRIFLADLIKLFCNIGKSLSTKVSNSILLECYGP